MKGRPPESDGGGSSPDDEGSWGGGGGLVGRGDMGGRVGRGDGDLGLLRRRWGAGKGPDGGGGSWGLTNVGWGDDDSGESEDEVAWGGGGCSDYSHEEDEDLGDEWLRAGDGDS